MTRALPAILIAIAFIAMLAWTWFGWPDPIVDFGRELYVPWQLSQGKVLYRDIAYFNGPLSPYFNALMFTILGVSLRTIVLTNIVIAAIVVAMIYKFWRMAGGRFSATIAALTFVVLFMCIQIVTIGNYNWITPYSHEITHGVALSLGAMLALVARRYWIAGLLVGLVFLTKPEVCLAIALATIFAAIVRDRSIRPLGLMAVGAVVPVIISTSLLGIRGTLGAWWYVFDSRLSSSHFYRHSMGMDQPAQNLRQVFIYFVGAVMVLGPAVIFDSIKLNRVARLVIALAYAFAIAFAMMYFQNRIAWPDLLRGLTPIAAIASIVLIVQVLRRSRPRLLLRAMLAIFAAVLLAKLLLVARIYHYGFALALPAMLVTLAMLVSWIPRWIERRRNHSAPALRLAALAVLGVVTFQYLREYANGFHHKPVVVAQGAADEFRADERGQAVDDMVQILSVLPRDSTLAVVPEGSMINYLARFENSTGYISLMPPEMTMFGQRRILDAFQKRPPDYIVLVQSDLSGYGYQSFEEFMGEIYAWIQANYTPVPTPPNPAIRMMLLRRK